MISSALILISLACPSAPPDGSEQHSQQNEERTTTNKDSDQVRGNGELTMNHNGRIRQTHPVSLFAACQQNRAHGCGLANTYRVHGWTDKLRPGVRLISLIASLVRHDRRGPVYVPASE
jgi:hypothetical protein